MSFNVVSNLDRFNAFFDQPTLHPMVGIGDLSKADKSIFEPTDFTSYCVILMNSNCGEMVKSGRTIQYKQGTMVTVRPGDVISMNLAPDARPMGMMLLFRPEMIENTGLGRDFYMFNYFDYDVGEALELTDREHEVMMNCFANIQAELDAKNDELTGHMLRLGIGQMLSYCKRFYERQFDTRKFHNSDMMVKLDAMLDSYLAGEGGLMETLGYPTVTWCASQFHLTPNYFGNMVRRQAHVSAQEYIQNKMVERAKELLADPALSIDDIAFRLGFTYPNHFTRMFRKKTGLAPSAYRKR